MASSSDSGGADTRDGNQTGSGTTVNRISRLIAERILGGESPVRIGPDTGLLSSGLTLDSIAVLELIMEIENEFGIEFSDSDLTVELFRSVRTLADAIQRKALNGNGTSPNTRESA